MNLTMFITFAIIGVLAYVIISSDKLCKIIAILAIGYIVMISYGKISMYVAKCIALFN